MSKRYLVGSQLFLRISDIKPGSWRKGIEPIVTLFNSGKHLYIDLEPPHWYEEWEQPIIFLNYREYCGNGKDIYGIRVQHLGHLFGVLGGDARVALTLGSTKWNINLNPCRLYTIAMMHAQQVLFMSNKVVVLPKTLLSRG